MNTIFRKEMDVLESSLASMDEAVFRRLVHDCKSALKQGNKIVASGLGKNVPISEKFVGTMLSLGMPAAFMHTNSAIHGDMGMIRNGDVVILLTKSGETAESIHLYNLLSKRDIFIWLLTFSRESALARAIPNTLALDLEHECDAWNIVPNASSIINLIVLQKLCTLLAQENGITLADFKRNHPGGHIGEQLKCIS